MTIFLDMIGCGQSMSNNFDKINDNDDAVSPVIATILMVAITVVLSGVLYTWASELANTQTSAGPLNNYAVENVYEPSENGIEDRLLRLSFSSGPEDLKWSFLTIALFEEIDAKTYKCSPTSEKCIINEEEPDNVWAGNEIITLSENGEDICVYGNDCNLVVSIQYKGKSIAGDTGITDLSTKTVSNNCENNPLCSISFDDDTDLNEGSENLGHYGPGGDDLEIWEENLVWTCIGCNGKDLADAETINGVDIDTTKGIIYLSETKETIFNVGIPTWRTYSSAQSSSNYGQHVPEATSAVLCEEAAAQADMTWDGVFSHAELHGITPGCYIVGNGVYEWQGSSYGQFVHEATSAVLCEEEAMQAGMTWDGVFTDAELHGITPGCYIVGNGVYEWQGIDLGSTKYGHFGTGGDDSEIWEENLVWTCNNCNGKDLSDATTINGISIDITKGIIYVLDTKQTIFNSANPVWRAYSSTENSETGSTNYGHYGPGGDDSDIWEETLVWTCNSCNGKDLADAETINGMNIDTSKGIAYNLNSKVTYLDIEEFTEVTNYGHNGPGGDDDFLWENNLVWTCIGCNGKDLSDASTIGSVAIDSSKGVLFNLESQETTFNVDEPEDNDPNLVWREFGAFHEYFVWRAYTSTGSSSAMAAAAFYETLMETFINGDADTFYNNFEGEDVVIWGGFSGCLDYEDVNNNDQYDTNEICNFDTNIESIRTNEESLCQDSTDEYCHPIGRDYSDYTMDDFNSDYDIVIKDNSQILDGDCGFFMDDGFNEDQIRDACIDFMVQQSNWPTHFGDDDYLAFTSWKYDYNQEENTNWFWDDPTIMVISYNEGTWTISWWLGLD